MSHLRFQTITSLDAPEVAPYRTLRRSVRRSVTGFERDFRRTDPGRWRRQAGSA